MKKIADEITLADGVRLSIQASNNHYCIPRNDEGPYTHVEVGFIRKGDEPITPPRSWRKYADGAFPSEVYGYVPVELVEKFIASHGGRKFLHI